MGHVAYAAFNNVATSQVQVAASRIHSAWPWYVVRASGLVGVALLILLMLSGIGQVTGLTYRFIEPIKAWALHKAMALALCGAILMHVTFLLIDHYISFSLVQVLVPFVSHYSNHSTLFGVGLSSIGVAFGILAAYGVVIIVLSSLGWIDTKKGAWKKRLHYISYFVMVAALVHGLSVGSDLRYGLFRQVWLLLAGVMVLAVVSRMWRMGTLRKKE